MPVTHGKYWTYADTGCRCDLCRRAWADHAHDYRQRNLEVHLAYQRKWQQACRDRRKEERRALLQAQTWSVEQDIRDEINDLNDIYLAAYIGVQIND